MIADGVHGGCYIGVQSYDFYANEGFVCAAAKEKCLTHHGERTIRTAVFMQKNDYGNRSDASAEVKATWMSII